MDSVSGSTDREGPKINGSAAAFYALIIILSLVIAVAFAAVLYLWREEKANRRADSRRTQQPVDDEAVKDSSHQPSPRWYTRIFRLRSGGRSNRVRDVSISRRGQGWIQAGTTDEWESDSGEDSKPRALSSISHEYSHSSHTNRTSAMYSVPPQSLVHSFVSDSRCSVLPSDSIPVSYEDTYAPSVRYSIPSIYSHLLPASSGASSHLTHQPNCSISTVAATPVTISTSPPMPSSPVSIEYPPSDSNHGSEFSQKPSLRTFGGGTKFIEAL